jgi:hypothetical protein
MFLAPIDQEQEERVHSMPRFTFSYRLSLISSLLLCPNLVTTKSTGNYPSSMNFPENDCAVTCRLTYSSLTSISNPRKEIMPPIRRPWKKNQTIYPILHSSPILKLKCKVLESSKMILGSFTIDLGFSTEQRWKNALPDHSIYH